MRLISVLSPNWQKLAHEIAKFGTVGLINTAVSWGVANILLHTVLPHGELKATLIGSGLATITAYLLNRFWTYRHRPTGAMSREYALFFLFNLIGVGIDLGVVYVVRDMLGLTSLLAYNIARVIGLVLGTTFRFWAYRTLVFRAPAEEPATAEPVAVASDQTLAKRGVVNGAVKLPAPTVPEVTTKLASTIR